MSLELTFSNLHLCFTVTQFCTLLALLQVALLSAELVGGTWGEMLLTRKVLTASEGRGALTPSSQETPERKGVEKSKSRGWGNGRRQKDIFWIWHSLCTYELTPAGNTCADPRETGVLSGV